MVYKANIKSYLPELILDATSAPIFAVDRNNSIIIWNYSLTVLTGISSDWALGRSFPDTFLSPDGAVAWAREIEGLNGRAFEVTNVHVKNVQVRTEWKIPGRPPISLTCSLAAAPLDLGAGYLVGTILDAENSRPPDRSHELDLSRELLEDSAAEMRELSRFLHDTLTQDLVRLSFFVYQASAALNATGNAEGIDTRMALELVARCCKDVRAVSSIVAPMPQDDTPLHSLIDQYMDCLGDETGLAITTDLDPVPTLPRDLHLLLVTIAQMWTVRAVRSAPCSAVAVRLRDRGNIAAMDLETYWPAPGQRSGYLAGWSLIRERVLALGGEFSIVPDSHTLRCRVHVPCI
jgi:signal transduction histidine kinase